MAEFTTRPAAEQNHVPDGSGRPSCYRPAPILRLDLPTSSRRRSCTCAPVVNTCRAWPSQRSWQAGPWVVVPAPQFCHRGLDRPGVMPEARISLSFKMVRWTCARISAPNTAGPSRKSHTALEVTSNETKGKERYRPAPNGGTPGSPDIWLAPRVCRPGSCGLGSPYRRRRRLVLVPAATSNRMAFASAELTRPFRVGGGSHPIHTLGVPGHLWVARPSGRIQWKEISTRAGPSGSAGLHPIWVRAAGGKRVVRITICLPPTTHHGDGRSRPEFTHATSMDRCTLTAGTCLIGKVRPYPFSTTH